MALFAEFFGGKPKVPNFVPVDAQQQQRVAISGNLAALPDIEALAARYNQFNVDQINKTLGTTDPFAGEIAKNLSKNRLDWSKGVISKDVADLVQSQTASRAVSGGFGGTGMHDAALARNYGLTSLDLQKLAQSSEESWLRTAAAIYEPGMFQPSSMFITPQQQIALATEERNAKFQRDYVKNQWDWYGSFGQQAVRFQDTLVQLAGDIAGAAMG